MSGRRDESLILEDITGAAERLVELGGELPVGGLGQDQAHNEMLQWNLVVLGEATKRLSQGVRDRFPDVPWHEMARTRDRIAHHYEGVNWYRVEGIVRTELPALIPRLTEIRDLLRAEFDAR